MFGYNLVPAHPDYIKIILKLLHFILIYKNKIFFNQNKIIKNRILQCNMKNE